MIWFDDISNKWCRTCKCGEVAYYNHKKSVIRTDKHNNGCSKCRINNFKKTVNKSETKQKWIDCKIGNNNGFYGKSHTDETKSILRKKCTVYSKFGKSVDYGSDEYFKNMEQYGFNIQQNYFLKDLGYFADGYDKDKHTWIEYDTKYHKRGTQKILDKKREKEIIDHYISIGKPLSQFLRYDVVNKRLNVVYRGKDCLKYIYGEFYEYN